MIQEYSSGGSLHEVIHVDAYARMSATQRLLLSAVFLRRGLLFLYAASQAGYTDAYSLLHLLRLFLS